MKTDRNSTEHPQVSPGLPAALSKSGYAVPVAISVAMHAVLVVLVVWGWQTTPAPKQKIMPRYVEATLVTIKPQAAEPAAAAPKPKVVDVAARQQEQQRQKAEAEQKKRLATEQAERERLRKLAEEKKKKEQELADKKKKEQAEAERKKREQAEAEKKRLEQERLKQEQQLRQEAAFSEALAEEAAMLNAQQSEVTAQSYVALMAQRIERNWSRPPSARTGMQCELRIQLVPTGQVVSVTVTRSSGNAAFDRSAVAAVERVGRFEELQKVPSDVFEQHFRQVNILFNPRDLRL